MTVPHPGAPQILLLGLGNDLLSDDAVGLRVAAEVQQQIADAPNVTVVATAEMGLSLLDLAVGYDEVVIVDAIQTGQAPPGFVHEMDLSGLRTLSAVSPHFLGMGELFALGREVGLEVPRRTRIFAVEVADPFTLGTQLTPPVESALPGVVGRVMTELRHAVGSGTACAGLAD